MLLSAAFLGDSVLGGGYQPWNKKGLLPAVFELPGYELSRVLLAVRRQVREHRLVRRRRRDRRRGADAPQAGDDVAARSASVRNRGW
jgi:hypothetical protein